MSMNLIISVLSVAFAFVSIFFTYLSFRRNSLLDQRNEGKHQGTMFSDIGYIKAIVDRVEKNLNKVDERYQDVISRVIKNEEAIGNLSKRIDELSILKGG